VDQIGETRAMENSETKPFAATTTSTESASRFPYTPILTLFITLQDPEMMREAQKMMQDPAFQAQMKQMMAGNLGQAMQQTKQAMQDPAKVKEMEEKAQAAITEGNKELERLEKERQEKGDQKPTAKGDDDDDEVPKVPSLNLN